MTSSSFGVGKETKFDFVETLTGFQETSYHKTQAKFAVADGHLVSRVNGRSWAIGEFEMASLAELRTRAAKCEPRRDKPKVSVIQGDVRELHAKLEYADALFQLASQFYALEMIGTDIMPEAGVTRYAGDRTQGPACAITAAPATIYRNYFVPVGGGLGQTRMRQLDALAAIGATLATALSRPVADLWRMTNGYALCSAAGLKAIAAWLAKADAEEIDDIRARLSIGLQRGVEITAPYAPPGHLVSQAFCSAVPVIYTNVPMPQWSAFATLVLEAAYEAILRVGAVQAASGGSNVVVLTLVGDGACGNTRE